MDVYHDQKNPEIILIPAKKKTQEEINRALEHEREITRLREELMQLYQEMPRYETRIDELKRIKAILDNECANLQKELEQAKVRSHELEQLLKQ